MEWAAWAELIYTGGDSSWENSIGMAPKLNLIKMPLFNFVLQPRQSAKMANHISCLVGVPKREKMNEKENFKSCLFLQEIKVNIGIVSC